ncbi:MAG: leucyl aminopeptidase [Gloeomargarita sp. SKYBB_i_bin120]|nr:leucyl aminopeptidase [Gloeomargarita sp. SKYB120]MDW8178845.1 leucyl aminopeptidase [Gloeomargarita sp. SKYBB_i_bin120]
MEFVTVTTAPQDWTGDLLCVGFWQDEVALTGDVAALNDRLGNALQEFLDETEFKGKPGHAQVVRLGAGSPVKKLALVGLGKRNGSYLEPYRQAAAASAKAAKTHKARQLGLYVPPTDQPADALTAALTEGILLALHQDNRFKSDPEDKPPVLERVEFLSISGGQAGIEQAQKVVSGVILARELVNAPASVVTPTTLAETALSLAQTYGFNVTILEREDCQRLGMGAFLGVAQGSDTPPKFIHLTYTPAVTPKKRLAIIGKGLTFDSGGLNLKTQGGIETMKMDMAGAAAVLGCFKVLGQLQPPVQVHGIIAATENMINGHALHPGDILTASNGKTIEVNNTDAEGRLTLADALVYAEKLDVDAIVDLATLTGACIVALGDDIAGLWSTSDDLANELLQASSATGEKIWRMPLEDKYFESMKSPIADMKNAGGRSAGSITGALFLKQFVQKTPWAHLDVAGPVWSEKGNTYSGPGATGFGVRLLVQWLLNQ